MLIGSSSGYSAGARYSPDGRRIAFHSNRSGAWEVGTCDADGADCRQLTSFGDQSGGSPCWSRDGRFLAIDSRIHGQSEIYVINSDGGPLRRITDHPASDMMPTWSWDDRWIYFGSDRSGRYEIWKAPSQGGEAIQVTKDGGLAGFESTDGRYLYYAKSIPGSIFRIPAAGGDEIALPARVAGFFYFAVTSKGVYFIPDSKTIRLLEFATGRIRVLAELRNSTQPLGLAVSPDDAYVLWTQRDSDSRDLMLVDNFR
jgi:dipeptidyl aminopeptidase/acylaminoacyl peptidase